MLSFRRTPIEDIVIEYPDQIAEICNKYLVTKGGTSIAELYGGDKFSFIQLSDCKFKITRRRRRFAKTEYEILNHENNELIGKLNFFVDGATCVLTLIDGRVYWFNEKSSDSHWLKPKTWNNYECVMTGDNENAQYTGKFLKKKIFEGEIDTFNEDLFPIMCGLFVIEEKLRIDQENAG